MKNMKFNCVIQPADTMEVSAGTAQGATLLTINHGTTVAHHFLSPADALALAEAIIRDHNLKAIPVVAREPAPKPAVVKNYSALSPQCQTLLQHCRRAGSITARDAMNDYGITSATLVRRFCDLEEAGWEVKRDRRVHPISQKRYTRYSVVE